MLFEDFVSGSLERSYEHWKMGSLLTSNLEQAKMLILWVADFRGGDRSCENIDFQLIKDDFYQLSKADFELPICDLGQLVSGRTFSDTQYALQEILMFCHHRKITPIVVGGSQALSHTMFKALNIFQKDITCTQITNVISLSHQGEDLTDLNYLNKILTSKELSIKDYHILGYQKHLNEPQTINIMQELNFDVLRLADMMGAIGNIEPFFRKADLVTINCDAVESFAGAFSLNPQVNGLNRREICACMKEIGMGESLKSVGIFNYNFEAKNSLNHQLLAQMLWYLLEGINIQCTHPKEPNYETHYVMIGEASYAFRRDTFKNLWYFQNDDSEEEWLPCLFQDFENAKRGILNKRFLRF